MHVLLGHSLLGHNLSARRLAEVAPIDDQDVFASAEQALRTAGIGFEVVWSTELAAAA